MNGKSPPSGSLESLKVRGALLMKGITIKALALEWGVGYSAVSRVINGQKPHSPIRQSVTEIIGFWPWPEHDSAIIYSREPRQ